MFSAGRTRLLCLSSNIFCSCSSAVFDFFSGYLLFRLLRSSLSVMFHFRCVSVTGNSQSKMKTIVMLIKVLFSLGTSSSPASG